MFNDSFKAVVRKVTIKAREDKGRNVLAKVLEPQFRTEFGADIARGLGDAAAKAQKSIADGGMKRAIIPIDALSLHLTIFSGAEQFVVKQCRGTTAVVSADKDGGPVMTFGVNFSMTDDALIFLARKLGGQEVTLRVKRSQTTLPLEVPLETPAKKKSAKAKKEKPGAKKRQADLPAT